MDLGATVLGGGNNFNREGTMITRILAGALMTVVMFAGMPALADDPAPPAGGESFAVANPPAETPPATTQQAPSHPKKAKKAKKARKQKKARKGKKGGKRPGTSTAPAAPAPGAPAAAPSHP